jgi:hypothetical protein
MRLRRFFDKQAADRGSSDLSLSEVVVVRPRSPRAERCTAPLRY